MAHINENYLKLAAGYLFPEIGRRVTEFQTKNPNADVIKMGIGDVTMPLVPSVVKAFQKGVEDMSNPDTFKGYGPEQGYAFLRDAIAKHDYQDKGVNVSADEIFVSDGSKCDTGNILEVFGLDNKIAVQDPVYPVYVDTSVMGGRTGLKQNSGYYDGLVYMPCTEKTGFIPELPTEKVDIIFLCYPNNPTGTTATRDELTKWVKYAKENKSIILFDAAYEAFITEDDVPHSIYEIEGAREVAIEFRSFSKKAGFTGTRLGFTVIPKELVAYTSDDEAKPVHALWSRRHSTKFNGASYPVQKAAMGVYTEAGKKEVQDIIDYYMDNARIMRESLTEMGFKVYGGVNAPYVWVKKGETPSWDLFDLFLNEAHVVGTPGSGFGPSGETYFRFSAFASRENVIEAMERIKKM